MYFGQILEAIRNNQTISDADLRHCAESSMCANYVGDLYMFAREYQRKDDQLADRYKVTGNRLQKKIEAKFAAAGGMVLSC